MTPSAGSAAEGFVQAWTRALRTACLSGMTRTDLAQFLAGLTDRLATALAGETFEPAVGYQVGTDLVRAGCFEPEVVSCTMRVIRERLVTDLGLSGPDRDVRVAGLLEQFAAGFAAAVRDRTLDGQDDVRLAALTTVQRAQERFRHLATHDLLTGLANRTQLTGWLRHAIAAGAAGVGVTCLDLDGFQAINDSLGNEIGDRLLIMVAERLRGLARPDRLVVRLGGDEFAIACQRTTSADEVVKVADAALRLIAEPFHIDDHELPVTASAGVHERLAVGADPAELVRAANIALHWAKDSGKARWERYDPQRSNRDAVRYRLSAAMPAALRHGQFTLLYQPLVELVTGRLVGVEGLARWRHPDYGLLTPDRFIGLAEDTGLIVPLGTYLLEQACRQAAGWAATSADPPYVSVNLAARQLRHPGLVATVVEILDRTGLDPRLLQLEITEGTAIEPGATAATLRRLAEFGVRAVIDDFGTGHANLAWLHALPLHGIKIAAEFVPPAHGAHVADATFLASVIDLAHGRGLQVTAEGIETQEQEWQLRAVRCDTGQGWYYGRPTSAQAITGRVVGPDRTHGGSGVRGGS